MTLSDEAVFVYVLAGSGVRGRLTSGRIERSPAGTLVVYDSGGNRVDYLSGGRLRSWCVVNQHQEPIHGWREIQPEDLPNILREDTQV